MSLKKVDVNMLHGYVSPGFEKVKEEFERNFLERDGPSVRYTIKPLA